MTQQQEQQAEIEITAEDLNRLWAINPLAQSQFQNIIQQKQINDLQAKLSEQSDDDKKPDISPNGNSPKNS